MTTILAAALIAGLLPSAGPSLRFHRPRPSSSVVLCDSVQPKANDAIERTITELLAQMSAPERLPSLLSQQLSVLTNADFMVRLQARREAMGVDEQRDDVDQLEDLVMTFLEEVTARIQAIEPELVDAQSQADEAVAKAAAAASAARTTGPRPSRARANADQDATPAMAPKMPSADNQSRRQQRAQHRFLLETLLAAAKEGQDALDSRLRESRDALNPDFFEHLQWEVEQQREAQNRPMLNILEAIVQRACVEVENGQVEVALLSAALQTSNPSARREMYERQLKPAGRSVVRAFAQLVKETQLEVEKRVLRGETVDASLLQMLRVISVEATEYDEDDSDGDSAAFDA